MHWLTLHIELAVLYCGYLKFKHSILWLTVDFCVEFLKVRKSYDVELLANKIMQ